MAAVSYSVKMKILECLHCVVYKMGVKASKEFLKYRLIFNQKVGFIRQLIVGDERYVNTKLALRSRRRTTTKTEDPASKVLLI